MIRNTEVSSTLADLQMAVDLRRPVTIDYERADGTRTVRVIEPFEIPPYTRAGRRLVRAMDRQSRQVRSFRIDRLYAYRVAPRRSRFQVSRALAPVVAEETKPATAAVWAPVVSVVDKISSTADWDAEWADFNELQYDPDAPVPYLPTDYPEA